MSQGVGIALGGTAVVCCIHDRVKREVTTEAHIAELGLIAGHAYDPTQHKIHMCTCCENLFIDPSDIPQYCIVCRQPAIHAAGGPLPEPKGVVNE